jgi:hypothetical protein
MEMEPLLLLQKKCLLCECECKCNRKFVVLYKWGKEEKRRCGMETHFKRKTVLLAFFLVQRGWDVNRIILKIINACYLILRDY